MDGNYISSDAITNENGEAQIHLFKITKNIPVQYLKVSVDLSEFADAFNVNETESLSIKVNVNPPNIYLDIAENNLDEPLKNPFVIPALKLFLLKTYGAEFVNIRADSDYYILATINTTAKMDTQNEYGLYQVYADGTISFFNTESNKEMYQKSINNIMGADFHSLEGAGRNALKKMVDKMETSTFQEIITGINDFLSKNK